MYRGRYRSSWELFDAVFRWWSLWKSLRRGADRCRYALLFEAALILYSAGLLGIEVRWYRSLLKMKAVLLKYLGRVPNPDRSIEEMAQSLIEGRLPPGVEECAVALGILPLEAVAERIAERQMSARLGREARSRRHAKRHATRGQCVAGGAQPQALRGASGGRVSVEEVIEKARREGRRPLEVLLDAYASG